MTESVPTDHQTTPHVAPEAAFHLQGGARTKLVWSLLITNTALFACYFAAGSVLLPAQVAGINAARKETNLAIVTSISSFCTLFCQPIVGAFSDRTRNRLGRRAPWMLGGAFLGGIMLMLIPYLGSRIWILAIMWVLAQVSLNALQGPMTAMLADRLDPNYRATASAFIGVGTMVGITIGIVVAGRLVARLGLGYTVVALAVIICTVLLIALNQDRHSRDMVVSQFHWGPFFKNFWISPRQYPDFGWAFAQRFTFMLGYAGISAYMLYILLSYVKLPLEQAGTFIGTQQIAGAVASVIATFAVGPISDRLGRRKIFVLLASLLVALGCVVPLLTPTTTGIMAYAILAGAGTGAYLAVDVALIVDVLPHPEDAAKDLGVMNIANNVPQTLAPVIFAGIIPLFGYASVWIWSIILVTAASVMVYRIKKVR